MTPGDREYDLVIIGGGLAGCALAIASARRLRRVALLEQDSFPRDKLCGEFLSPESRRIFDELGITSTIERLAPERIHSARFSAPSGRRAVFELPGSAWGLSRRALDRAIFETAAESGADAFERTAVTEVRIVPRGARPAQVRAIARGPSGETLAFTAPVAAGTYGRRSVIDRQLERGFLATRPRFVGLKRHHRPAASVAGRELEDELRGHVEIHAFAGGYCGVSFVEGDTVNVCALLETRVLRAIHSGDWNRIREHLAGASRALGRRLEGLEPDESELLAVGDVGFGVRDVAGEALFHAGDAAGMIPPLAGDGQAMALDSGCRLAALLAGLPDRPDDGELARARETWRELWRRTYGPRMRVARRVQRALLAGRLPAELSVRALTLAPSLGRLLARWTRGV